MLIKFYDELDKYEPINLEVTDIRQVVAGIKHTYGDELSELLLQNEYKYILCNSKNTEDIVALHPGLVSMNFGHYDSLWIIPNIEGEGAAIVVAIAGAAFAATWAGIAVAAVINIAIAIAIGMVMQLLSPTPSFTHDPASTQSAANKLESNLFNGAPNIREQGGSVPLIYGQPMCGGVLISAGLTTEEVSL